MMWCVNITGICTFDFYRWCLKVVELCQILLISNIFLTGRKKKVRLFIVNHLPGFCTSNLLVLGIPWNINQLPINTGRQYIFLSHSQNNVPAKWFYEGVFRDKGHVTWEKYSMLWSRMLFLHKFFSREYFFFYTRQSRLYNLKCLSTLK